jgi:hypothetical protein
MTVHILQSRSESNWAAGEKCDLTGTYLIPGMEYDAWAKRPGTVDSRSHGGSFGLRARRYGGLVLARFAGNSSTGRLGLIGHQRAIRTVAMRLSVGTKEGRMALSRRHLFKSAMTVAGAAGFGGLASRSFADSAPTVSKQNAGYQDQPKGQQSCSLCNNFVSPSSCQMVI